MHPLIFYNKSFETDKLYQDLLDPLSPHFHHIPACFRSLKEVAMATNFSVKIGETDLFSFIRRHDIRKRILISHF